MTTLTLKEKIREYSKNERIGEIRNSISLIDTIKRQEIRDLSIQYAKKVRERLELPDYMRASIGGRSLILEDGIFTIEKEWLTLDGEKAAYIVEINFPGMSNRLVFRDECSLDESYREYNDRIESTYKYFSYFTRIMNDSNLINRAVELIEELHTLIDEVYKNHPTEDLYKEERTLKDVIAQNIVDHIKVGDSFGENNSFVYSDKFDYHSNLVVVNITEKNFGVSGTHRGLETVKRIPIKDMFNKVRHAITIEVDNIYGEN